VIDAIRAVSYLFAGLLFILSLRGLSAQETARRGNLYGLVGMILAVAATALALLVRREGEETSRSASAARSGRCSPRASR
jgi:NAD/NADP transhydrogenase beta subunit